MAFTHDIFISYGHLDDEDPAGDVKGWVDLLVERLPRLISNSLGYQPKNLARRSQPARHLDIVEKAGKFYAERGDVAAAESFYQLVFPNEAWPSVQTVPVWPEAFSKSLVAMAPTSCLDSMIRILESYAALLEKAGRARDAGLISHGVARLVERKVAEEGQPPR